MMLDLVNGKTVLCRVRELTPQEESDLFEDDIVDNDFIVLSSPRVLHLTPTGHGMAHILLTPYLNGRDVTVYTGSIVASAQASKLFSDQYVSDTSNLPADTCIHEPPSMLS